MFGPNTKPRRKLDDWLQPSPRVYNGWKWWLMGESHSARLLLALLGTDLIESFHDLGTVCVLQVLE